MSAEVGEPASLGSDVVAAALNASEALVVALDGDDCVVAANPAVDEAMGQKRAEVIGRSVRELVHPADAPALVAAVSELRSTAIPGQVETRLLPRSGDERLVRWSLRAVPGDDGHPDLAVLTGVDVTAERNLEVSHQELALEIDLITRTLPIGYFAATSETSPPGLAIRAANERFTQLTGWSPKADAPVDIEQFLGTGHQSTVTAALDAVAAGEHFEGRLTLQRAEGGFITAELRLEPISGADGRVQGCIGWVVDLSAEVRARQDADRRARILDATADLVLDVLSTGEVLDVNEAVQRAADRPIEHVRDLFDEESVNVLLADAAAAVRRDDPWESELRIVTASGTKVPVAVTALADDTPTSVPTLGSARLTLVARDISPLKDLEQHLVRLSFHDELTGLPNRELALDRLEQALDRATRSQDFVGVLILDLDYFKSVNDDLGHAAGDELLRMSAGRLKAALRPADTVARLGGDEFLIILEGIHEPSGLVDIADRVRTSIVKPFTISGHSVRTSASIGASMAKNNKIAPKELIAQADVAAYRAKESGRNRYELSWESADD